MTNPRSNNSRHKQNFSQLNQHELKMMKVTLLCLATLLAAPVPGQGQLVRGYLRQRGFCSSRWPASLVTAHRVFVAAYRDLEGHRQLT